MSSSSFVSLEGWAGVPFSWFSEDAEAQHCVGMGVSCSGFFFSQSVCRAKKKRVCNTSSADSTTMCTMMIPALLAKLGLLLGVPMVRMNRVSVSYGWLALKPAYQPWFIDCHIGRHLQPQSYPPPLICQVLTGATRSMHLTEILHCGKRSKYLWPCTKCSEDNCLIWICVL